MILSLAERIDLTEKRIAALAGVRHGDARKHVADLKRRLAEMHDEADALESAASAHSVDVHEKVERFA